MLIALKEKTIATGNDRGTRDYRESRDKREHRINVETSAFEVHLVGSEGEQLGIVDTREALRMAPKPSSLCNWCSACATRWWSSAWWSRSPSLKAAK
jgi:hypothetical protein